MATVRDKAAIRRRLRAAGRRRERAQLAEAESIVEIAEAFRDGQAAGLPIKEMAELAGVTRQTTYDLLRRER